MLTIAQKGAQKGSRKSGVRHSASLKKWSPRPPRTKKGPAWLAPRICNNRIRHMVKRSSKRQQRKLSRTVCEPEKVESVTSKNKKGPVRLATRICTDARALLAVLGLVIIHYGASDAQTQTHTHTTTITNTQTQTQTQNKHANTNTQTQTQTQTRNKLKHTNTQTHKTDTHIHTNKH